MCGSCIEYGRFEAKIREIREQMLQTTGSDGGGIQSQQQTGRFVRFLLVVLAYTYVYSSQGQTI